MRTGVVNSNLVELNEELRLPYIPDLISRKQAGENSTLSDSDLTLFASEKDRLEILLKKAGENSRLPESPSARPELEDLLIRLRLGRAED